VWDNAPRPPGTPDALSSGPRARIVTALVAQLSGTLEREQGDGTKVRVTMRLSEPRKSTAATH
jgi:two-component sensor histidine kinase